MFIIQETLSSSISFLPPTEHDFWVREMSKNQLDFQNPEGLETFNCFKQVCVIERNTNENFRNEPETKRRGQVVDNAGQQSPRSATVPAAKKMPRSSHKVQIEKRDSLDSESESSAYTTFNRSVKPWSPSPKMKFPCALKDHKHEVSQCPKFFKMSPVAKWKSVSRSRVRYTCLRPRLVCTEKLCSFSKKIPDVLKCQICAPWAESKGLAPLSVLFCAKKSHGDARAPLNVLKSALEKYIGKLETSIVDSSINLLVSFMQEKPSVIGADTSTRFRNWVQSSV